jgi:uncharacterized membrane protein
MRLRRQVPWIHRYSRLLIGVIALLGVVNTGYLTWQKLSQTPGLCSAGGCNTVLASDYASFAGIPLTLMGLLSYVAIAVMAFAPSFIDPQSKRSAHQQLNTVTWLAMLALATGIAIFSGYLMILLAYVIKAACPFCIFSAISAAAIFLLTIFGREWEDIGQAIFIGIGAALLAAVTSLIFYNSVQPAIVSSLEPTTNPVQGTGWDIKTTSGPAEIALAEHLTKQGAKMYGAYWCHHCYVQKQLFGKQGWDRAPYSVLRMPLKTNPNQKCVRQQGLKVFPLGLLMAKPNRARRS